MYRISNFGWMPFSGVTVPLTRKHLMGGIIPLKIPLVAYAIDVVGVRKHESKPWLQPAKRRLFRRRRGAVCL